MDDQVNIRVLGNANGVCVFKVLQVGKNPVKGFSNHRNGRKDLE